MWDKEKIDVMFPSGVLPQKTPASELLQSDYARVVTQISKNARNMVTNIERVEWYNDGTVARYPIYDVYPFPKIEDQHLLSVYGGKMLQNWLQLPTYQNILNDNEEKGDSSYVGFNYTGL